MGKWLADRFDEYHRQNPGQLAIGQLTANTTTSTLLYGCMPLTRMAEDEIEVGTLQISAEDRINALEHEILSLRSKPVFDGIEIPCIRRGQPIREPPVAIPQTSMQPSTNSAKHASEVPPVTSQPSSKITELPTHPFSNIPEAQYIPPTKRNFAAPAEKEKSSKEPAYRTIAPIHSSQFAEEVYTQSMKLPFVTLSPEELCTIHFTRVSTKDARCSNTEENLPDRDRKGI